MKRLWLSILTLAACQKSGCADEAPRGQPEPADGGAPKLAADANLERDAEQADTADGLDRVDPSRFSSDAIISVIGVITADAANSRDGGLFSDFDGGSGTRNCGETFQCILNNNCATTNTVCLNGCYSQATPEAQRLVQALADCALEPCGPLITLVRNGQISQDDLISCVAKACPNQLTACVANSQPRDAGERD